jgi:hypothetical protein
VGIIHRPFGSSFPNSQNLVQIQLQLLGPDEHEGKFAISAGADPLLPSSAISSTIILIKNIVVLVRL